MTVKRMDNVGIVVEDLDAAIEFFTELGLTLEGRAPIEGEWAGRVTGVRDQRVEIAMLRTPDGDSRLELLVDSIARLLGEQLVKVPALDETALAGARPAERLLVLSRRLAGGGRGPLTALLTERKVPIMIIGAPKAEQAGTGPSEAGPGRP